MKEENSHTICTQVLEKLERDHVVPISKRYFQLKNTGFWSLWGLSILFGSAAVAASIFVFSHAGWKYRSLTHDSFVSFFLDIVPFFWVLCIILMIFLAYYNIRHTTRGYRFSVLAIIAASIAASCIIGSLLYTFGAGYAIDMIRTPIPLGKPIIAFEQELWNNAPRGLLAGEIQSIDKSMKRFTLILFSGEEKSIFIDELSPEDTVYIKEHAFVRVIGHISSEQIITACAVLPWNMQNTLRFDKRLPLRPIEIGERKKEFERSSVCKENEPYKRYTNILITN